MLEIETRKFGEISNTIYKSQVQRYKFSAPIFFTEISQVGSEMIHWRPLKENLWEIEIEEFPSQLP